MNEKQKNTILVVDDEPLNIQVLSQALSPWYRIKAATSGEVALEIATSDDPPDLILLDIKMPGMDGYAVCKELKRRRSTAGIPVIFITGKNSAEDETRGLELGAVDYITKPFSVPIVLARVRNQILLKIKTDMLEELISTDSLTEVANRRRFDIALNDEWRRCLRSNKPIALLMIDLDYFKNVNDNYGHPAGDSCLKQIATILNQSMRRSADTLARFGGEEFAAIVPNANIVDATKLAEKMRHDVESLKISLPNTSQVVSVTTSLGVAACIPDKRNSPNTLLDAADEQLYRAKSEGRNCVRAIDISEQIVND
ncbi:MAG: diguanylate cyclase [Pseudomonadales bacterium]|nr:diguanylate cyclase [Pseudomonadales bacterium]